MQDLRNLEVWRYAHQLTLRIYSLTSSFPSHEQFGLTSQLRRGCSSIPTNLAEGCVKKTDSDFRRYCYNSMGSASETEYLTLLARDLSYLPQEDYESVLSDIQRIKRMLSALIKTLSQ